MMDGTSSIDGLPALWSNLSDFEFEDWINDVTFDNPPMTVFDPGMNAATSNPNYPNQPNKTIANMDDNFRGGQANKSQSGIPQEMKTGGSLPLNSTTTQQPKSGLSTTPNFVGNHGGQGAQSLNFSRTKDLPQYHHLNPTQARQSQELRQQILKNKAQLQFQQHTNSSMGEQNAMLCYQNSNHQVLSDQLHPYSEKMSNTQTDHLQNQQILGLQSNISRIPQQQHQIVQLTQNIQQNRNQMQLQFQQPAGAGGQQMLQAKMVGEIQKPQEKPQRDLPNGMSDLLAASVKSAAPIEPAASTAWHDQALKEISCVKQRYLPELRKMYKNADHFRRQAQNAETVERYEKLKAFLGKMIRFLNLRRADLFLLTKETVHLHMKIIMKYYASFKNNRNGVNHQNVPHQPTNNNARGPQQQAPNPPLGVSQGNANSGAHMTNFNQNYPSRRPPQAITRSSSNCGSLQIRTEQRCTTPLLLGPFKSAHPNILSSMNVPASTNNLLAPTNSNVLQSGQINHQQNNRNFHSEKMKQPMHKMNELSESKVGQLMLASGSRLRQQIPIPLTMQPINLHAASPQSSQHSVSSPHVEANNMLSPLSIARLSYLLSCPTPGLMDPEKQYSYSAISQLSTSDIQYPTTLMTPAQAGEQKIDKNQFLNTGAPATPSTFMAVTLSEGSKAADSGKEAHDRLIKAVKALSSKALNSSLQDIHSVMQAVDSIPEAELPAFQDQFQLGFETKPEGKLKRSFCVTSRDPQSPNSSDCEASEIDSTATSVHKRPKIEHLNEAIVDEIKETNRKLVETWLDAEKAADKLEDQDGTIVRCLYRTVCFPELFEQKGGASSGTVPTFILRLLVPTDYPNSSPRILGVTFLNVWGEQSVKLSEEVLSKFNMSLSGLSQPVSLGAMARSWDASARSVFTEFAKQRGRESFTSRYGSWESCTTTTSSS